jgi:hypothetical protein
VYQAKHTHAEENNYIIEMKKARRSAEANLKPSIAKRGTVFCVHWQVEEVV